MTNCFIGIDVGSKSVRAVAIGSDDGAILAKCEHPISYEVDPQDKSYITSSQEDLWNATVYCISGAIEHIAFETVVEAICVDATCSLAVSKVTSKGTVLPQDTDHLYGEGKCEEKDREKDKDKDTEKDKGIVFWMDHRSKECWTPDGCKEYLNKLGGCFIPEMAVPKVQKIYHDLRHLGREAEFQQLLFFDLHNWLECMLIDGPQNLNAKGSTLSEEWYNHENIGIDGSLAGFTLEFYNRSCKIPLQSEQIRQGRSRLDSGVPFAGEVLGTVNKSLESALGIKQKQPVNVCSGLIDCYASFFTNFATNNVPQNQICAENTVIMVAGTSACYLTASRKPIEPPNGMWGGFQIMPGQWFYEGGLSCCGILLENLFDYHPCSPKARGMNPKSASFWYEVDRMVKDETSAFSCPWMMNATKYYSGEYLGNRTPFNDSQISAYMIGGSMVPDRANFVSRYLLILEHIVLESRLMLQCFVEDSFPVKNILVCGSFSKNNLFLGLMSQVLHAKLGIYVVKSAGNAVDEKFQSALGMARLARSKLTSCAKLDAGTFSFIHSEDDQKLVELMDVKYEMLEHMIRLQQSFNDRVHNIT